MNYNFRHKNIYKETKQSSAFRILPCVILFFFCLLSSASFAQQIQSSIDPTSIKIGEQITYKIQIETDSIDFVVFPEGQTFLPLEMIESYQIDTARHDAKFRLIKRYGLTQFDSGIYTISRQKIIIGNKTIFTDSLTVKVNNIVVDTTKQGLFDIKPIIEVDKSPSNWWLYVLIILIFLGIIAFLLYWFIWREKPLTKEEKVALLPPYERAKLALQELDKSEYLQNEEIKEYYSELTGIIRTYLDEKVYDHSLESTTEELISRLHLLKDGQQIDLSKEDISTIENILKRADLVKFAKSKPDIALAELDRNTIDLEIDHIKESLPEPTEEEKLLNQKYKEEQERKKKQRKIITTIIVAVFLLFATVAGFVVKYGFEYVKDTIIGHESKELLEGNWVTSDYGFPPVTMNTPKVLERKDVEIPEEVKGKIRTTSFGYELDGKLSIIVITTVLNQKQKEIDAERFIERNLKSMENEGGKNIITMYDKFVTPNGAEGVKTYGTLELPKDKTNKDEYIKGKYQILVFISEGTVIQQIMMIWGNDDTYADQIIDRILNSIELIKPEE